MEGQGEWELNSITGGVFQGRFPRKLRILREGGNLLPILASVGILEAVAFEFVAGVRRSLSGYVGRSKRPLSPFPPTGPEGPCCRTSFEPGDRCVTRYRTMAKTCRFLLAALTICSSASGDWLDQHPYRQEVTINYLGNPSGALPDFPALLHVEGANPLFDHAQSNGYDIVITGADGTNTVPFEIEQYDPTGQKADIWVKTTAPALGDTTTLYMYYGKSGVTTDPSSNDTWDADHQLVQHFQEDPSGSGPQMLDSTAVGNDGTSGGGMLSTDQQPGKVGGALHFDGLDDHIDFGSDSSLEITGSFTLEGWMKMDVLNDYLQTIVGYSDSEQRGYKLALDERSTPNRIWFCANDNRVPRVYNNLLSYEGLEAGTWYHVASTYSPTRMETFVNGQSVNSKTPTSAPGAYGTYSVYAGRWGPFWFDGLLDEVRISDSVRDGDWFLASFNNQDDPNSVSFGAERLIPEPSTFLLILLGAAGLFTCARRRRR